MKGYEIIPGCEIFGLALYLRKDDALVFGDLHLGFEEELNRMGYMVPKFQYREIIRHLSGVFSKLGKNPKKAVICGDLRHGFGIPGPGERSEVADFLDYLKERCEEVVLVRGNHDTMLAPLAERRGVEPVDGFYLEESGAYVCHGHRIPRNNAFRKAETVVIGHDHPAVALKDGVRTEKVKCFLAGKWRGRNLVQLPSLNFITGGSDLLNEGALSPFMKEGRESFFAYCVEGFEVMPFGRLKDI